MPGSLPRVIRVLAHYYAPGGHVRAPRLPRRGPQLARRPRCRTIGAWRSSSRRRSSGSRSTRRPPATRRAARWCASRATSRPTRRCREVVAAASAALEGVNRYPDPESVALRARARRPLRRRRPSGSPSATAPATSCWRWARRCSSRAPSSSTRGPRSRSTRSSRPRRARAGSASRSTATSATTSTRWPREITVATRLVIVCNPNNPTSTALALEADRRVRRARALARLRADRRGLLRVQPARRPRRLDRAAANATRTSCCCAPSRRSTALCGLRVGYALCGSRDVPDALTAVRQPFFLQRRRAGRGARGAAPPGRGRAARRARRGGARADGGRASASSACSRRTRRPTSAGSRSATGATRPRSSTAWPREGVLVRAGSALGREGCLRVTYGTPSENDRFLEVLATLL